MGVARVSALKYVTSELHLKDCSNSLLKNKCTKHLKFQEWLCKPIFKKMFLSFIMIHETMYSIRDTQHSILSPQKHLECFSRISFLL